MLTEAQERCTTHDGQFLPLAIGGFPATDPFLD
jgi:hypothetical protein